MEKAFDFAEAGGYRRVVLMSNWVEYFYGPNGAFCFLENGRCTAGLDPAWFSSHLDAAFARTRDRLEALKKRGTDLHHHRLDAVQQFRCPNRACEAKILRPQYR